MTFRRCRAPQVGTPAYRQLWRVVEGAVPDAFANHPDYLSPKGTRLASSSVTKRVVGAVISYAEQSAQARSGCSPAGDTARGTDSIRESGTSATVSQGGQVLCGPGRQFFGRADVVRST